MVKEFCAERDWDQFHNPKDVAIGIVTEAAELIDHFRFKSEGDMAAMMKDPEKRRAISEELADVLYFTLRFAQLYDIDLAREFIRKMEINNMKYPVEKSRGSNLKYTEM